jgi:hypothetical protein
MLSDTNDELAKQMHNAGLATFVIIAGKTAVARKA